MFTARVSATGEMIDAASIDRHRIPGGITCPACRATVSPRMGESRRWHFAHLVNTSCEGQGESEAHTYAKTTIVEALARHPRAAHVEVEVPVGGRRADILLTLTDGQRVAVEVQRSDIEAAEADARTKDYTAASIRAVWVVPHRAPTFEHDRAVGGTHGHIAPTRAEVFFHALGRERVYFWAGGATVEAMHMEGANYWHTGELTRYNDQGGASTTTVCKPHMVKLKSYRQAYIAHQPLHLIDDFGPFTRHGFPHKGHMRGPYALWSDTVGPWFIDGTVEAARLLREQMPAPTKPRICVICRKNPWPCSHCQSPLTPHPHP